VKSKYLICLVLGVGLMAFGYRPPVSKGTLRVGILDTGLNMADPRITDHLCTGGYKDFTGEGMDDIENHGTFISSLVVKFAEDSDYCLVVVKFYKQHVDKDEQFTIYDAALKYLVNQGVSIINISAGGNDIDNFERNLILKNPRITFVVAAGNGSNDLSKNPYYPASYGFKNVIAVGATNMYGYRAPFSNYGDLVRTWEVGVRVEGVSNKGYIDLSSGTSEATATHTGRLIYQIKH
jgi:thermitase